MENEEFEEDLLKRLNGKRQAGVSLEDVVAHALLLSRVSREPDEIFARVIIRLLNPQPCEHTIELQSLRAGDEAHKRALEALGYLEELEELNPFRNDADNYFMELAKWGLGKRDGRPKMADFGIRG